jgi:hypothetical protein
LLLVNEDEVKKASTKFGAKMFRWRMARPSPVWEYFLERRRSVRETECPLLLLNGAKKESSF